MALHVSRQIYCLTMRYLVVLCVILTSTVCLRTVAGNRRCRPKIRESTCPCKSNTAGVLKRDGAKLLMCDGSQWKALQFEEPLGSNSKPGYSCKDIMDNGGQTADGAYWMTLTGRFFDLWSFSFCIF